MRNLILALAIATGAGLATTATEARADVTFSVQTPDLVYAAPGVQVVADYDEPVFFSDGFYWRYDNGVWYRSSVYYGGWEYWDAPPVYIRRIHRPYAYTHYHPRGYVRHYRPIAPRHDAHWMVRPGPSYRGTVHPYRERPMPPQRYAPHVEGHVHAGGRFEHHR